MAGLNGGYLMNFRVTKDFFLVLALGLCVLVPFLGGTFLASVSFDETPLVPAFVALAASAVCFLFAWSAVRRPTA